MPSQKGMEQALNWLHSMAMDKGSLNGINAELCLNVIADLKRQNEEKRYLLSKFRQKKIEDENKRFEQLKMDLENRNKEGRIDEY